MPTMDEHIADQPTASMTAAAHAYQIAMQQQEITTPTPTSVASPAPAPAPMADSMNDVVMADGASDRPASPAVLQNLTNGHAPSPIPGRIGTPSRLTNGNETSSRAASLHPDTVANIPSEAPPHGAPTRQYLNSKVVGPLLEGMKQLAKEQPQDPLRVLGEYLLQRSRELEGGNQQSI